MAEGPSMAEELIVGDTPPVTENRQEGSMVVDSSNLKPSELETEDPLIRELYNEIKTKNDEKMD